MSKKTDSLLFRFSMIFGIFTVIVMILSGVYTYVSQMQFYRLQCEENIRNIGNYLERMILAESDDFVNYQNYYMEHFAEVDIPYDFSEFQTAKQNFDELFASLYPETRFSDIPFEALDDDVKKAWFIWKHEYWLLTFEEARESFSLPYTYYLVPKEEIFYMVYMIDGERTHRALDGTKADSGEFLYLGDEYYDDPELYKVQWDAWFLPEKPEGYQVWDNTWGHTYAYYTPLVIEDKKLGLIGTEVEVVDVNKAILTNSIFQSIGIMIVLALSNIIMVIILNRRYISKLVFLEDTLQEYVQSKNPAIASKINKFSVGKDEISSLGRRFAAMIQELEEYIKNLLSTSQELKTTKKEAEMMNELANKDALTGIRNKTAYDAQVRQIEWQITDGFTDFGIAMIDLNFLKRINDTFGHEQGNIAIKKLCDIVCNIFEHSPVFRIGGDEFVVVLEGEDFKNYKELEEQFNAKIDSMVGNTELEQWERVSAAIGIALYNPESDENVSNVFKRADKAMYMRKKEMKAIREL